MRRSLVAGVVLVVALGACGSGSAGTAQSSKSSKVSTAVLADVPTRAAAAGSARFAMTFDLPAGTPGTMTASGVVDFDSNDMQMTMDMRDLTPSAPDVSYEVRMVDGVVYMNLGALASMGLPAGTKPWIKLDPTALGVSQSQLDQQQNPADFLDSLHGIADIREVGHERIRDVDTTEYDGTIDLGKAIDRAGPDARSRLEKALSVMEASVPVKVWVDGDGLPRRMQIAVDVQKMSMTMTMEFYDYGVAADVAPPPADQVGDLSSLTGPMRANAA